jgi:hypothetical protein
MGGIIQKVSKGFIQEFPFGVSIEESLNKGMKYLDIETSEITNWKDIIFTPFKEYIHHQIFLFGESKDMLIGFIVSQEATFLPDFISAIIQILGGINIIDDTADLIFVQDFIYNCLLFFIGLCSVKLAISLWLIINPYTMPWFVLLTATEWFMDSLAGVIPAFFGIEMGSSILLGILGSFAVYIKNLVLTMPYLPSEAIKETIGVHKVYAFTGLPKLWKLFEVPDNVREEWYNCTPYVTENLIKYYGNEGVEFLPSRVLKEIYQHDIPTTYINSIEVPAILLDSGSICNVSHNLDFSHFFSLLNI